MSMRFKDIEICMHFTHSIAVYIPISDIPRYFQMLRLLHNLQNLPGYHWSRSGWYDMSWFDAKDTDRTKPKPHDLNDIWSFDSIRSNWNPNGRCFPEVQGIFNWTSSTFFDTIALPNCLLVFHTSGSGSRCDYRGSLVLISKKFTEFTNIYVSTM